jgi:hypothetical protein
VALILFGALAALPPELVGQQVATATLAGRVRDEGGGAIAGAVIEVVAGDGRRVVTRETTALGMYRITGLAAGTYAVEVSHLGYRPDTSRVTLAEGQTATLDFTLAIAPIAVEGIEVVADLERARFEESAGATRRELTGAEIERVPGVLEPDPVRAVEVLPGVVSTSDFTAAFNVRGGSADQNLVLLDGVQLFNPFHLGGFFSVFNSDMLERAELMSGGFPAEYGGRVSSVLAVESDAGDGDFHGDIGVSLLAARLALGGGIPNGFANAIGFQSMRWRLSGRRSYADAIFPDVPYRLIDGQGVLEAWTSGGSRLQVTGYSGRDIVEPSEELLSDDTTGVAYQVDWRWGNDAVGARWTSPKADGGFFEARASYSRFTNRLDISSEDVSLDLNLGTGIEAFRGSVDFEEFIGRRWSLRSGLATERLEYDNFYDVNNARFSEAKGSGWLHSGYVQANWRNYDWLLEVGARLDHWRPAAGEAKWEPAPRLALKRFVGDRNAAIKVAVGSYTQFLHSLRDEQIPIGIDTWVLTGESAPVVRSNQVQLGYELYLGSNWFASIEGYLRRFDGLTTLNYGGDPNDATDDLLRGDGTSYGADLFLRRTGEGLTGWIAVSYLKADRTFPNNLSGLVPAPLVTAPAIFDRRLDIELVLKLEMPWGIESGLRWNIGTGMPYTRPIGQYGLHDPRGTADGRLEALTYTDEDDGELKYEYGVVLGPQSGERYPLYSRLDLSFRKPWQTSWGYIALRLDILNVYNRLNPLFYFYNLEKTPPTRSGISMFPLLPSIGVEISF